VYLYCYVYVYFILICFVSANVRTTATGWKLNCGSSSSSSNNNATLATNSTSGRIWAAAAAYHKLETDGMTYLQVLYTSRVMRINSIMVDSSPIQCLWYTRLLGNAVYSCTWASLQCSQITFSMPLLFIFCICLYKKDQSPSEVWVHSQVSWDVEFCEPDVIASIPPHYPYHVCCRNHIQNTCKHILFWILTTPPYSNTKQQIHIDTDTGRSAAAGTHSCYSTVSLLH
jgi:hypothetical protein